MTCVTYTALSYSISALPVVFLSQVVITGVPGSGLASLLQQVAAKW